MTFAERMDGVRDGQANAGLGKLRTGTVEAKAISDAEERRAQRDVEEIRGDFKIDRLRDG